MGVSVAEGTVVEWKKQPGERVERDEVICSISTDKIDTDVESPAAGTLAEIVVDVGTTVDVGTVLARLDTGGDQQSSGAGVNGDESLSEAAAALEAPGAAGSLQGDTAQEHDATAQEPPRPAANGNGQMRYSPVVMRIAAEHGIDLSTVTGTGRGGRIRKQDVLAAVESASAPAQEPPPMHIESPYKPDAPAAPAPRKPRFGREAAPAAPAPAPAAPAPAAAPAAAAPQGVQAADGQTLSRMRQAIGSRMVESLHTAATCTTVVEVDMTRIEAIRKAQGLTALAYVSRATIEALREFPMLNATLDGNVYTRHEQVNLGIAVALGTEGLMVPVIHDAQDLSVEGLAKRIRDVAQRTRANQLAPDEVRGGTFTITNPGSAGSLLATPIINLPQVAILDTEAIVKRPVVVTDELGNDSIAIRSMAYFCMSWDHRALDGLTAAQFLTALRRRLETWPID
jgi:pyruvate/2-oxoglutarate dehydrogenase complex dihydrolipoamide acyltransferase (E2) component